jgi:hypothetical protein
MISLILAPRGGYFQLFSIDVQKKKMQFNGKVISINQFNVKRVLKMDYENTPRVYLKYLMEFIR